jgi:hypothetical protein
MHGNVIVVLMNFVAVILKLIMLVKEHTRECLFTSIYDGLPALSNYMAWNDRKTSE